MNHFPYEDLPIWMDWSMSNNVEDFAKVTHLLIVMSKQLRKHGICIFFRSNYLKDEQTNRESHAVHYSKVIPLSGLIGRP